MKHDINYVLSHTPSELTWQDLYKFHYADTPELAKEQKRYYNAIEKTGGTWPQGVLAPPPNFNGNVIDYAEWAGKVADRTLSIKSMPTK